MKSPRLLVVLSASLILVPLSGSRFPAPLAAYSGTHQDRRPNIVLILSDDLGYGDLGSYGAPEAKTPNLDRLAKQGVRFRESYANGAVCTPTRAALMTGRYQQRVGLEVALGPDDTVNALPKTDATLPALLKQAGYATGLIGKWHLGFRQDRGPNAQGFDEFFGLLDGALDYYTHRTLTNAPALFENTTPVRVNGYITDVLTERAVSFIDRHASSPFFLEVAYNATHWPFQPPDDSVGSARRVAASTHPAMFVMRDLPSDSAARTREEYVRVLERMDQGVGAVLAALDRHQLTRNTLVIFTSDNGGEWLSRNAPFFHRKGTVWEGGIRVPLIMRWPARLPPRRVSRQVTTTMDLTASVLSAADVLPHESYPLDGVDLLPVASGARPVVERDLFWRIPRQRAVRSGRWKLLIDGPNVGDTQFFLFDLASDPGERNDLAKLHQPRVAELRTRLAAWERSVDASRR